MAEKLSVSKILLSNGACLDVKDKQWATPFLLAVKKNNRKLTKWLLDCGASVGEQDVYLKTGLHYAVEHGDHGLAFLIVQRLKTLIRVKDEEGRSPLHYAAHLGCAKVNHLKSMIHDSGCLIFILFPFLIHDLYSF